MSSLVCLHRHDNKNTAGIIGGYKDGSPKRIRTAVSGMRVRRPRPLDYGAMAGGPGFEPGRDDPESPMLPLHHPPTSYSIISALKP